MTEKGCDNCYYTYFDEGAYPCSLCIRGVERIDMWQPSKKTKADRKTEPTAYADGYADGQRDERERWERMADRKTEPTMEEWEERLEWEELQDWKDKIWAEARYCPTCGQMYPKWIREKTEPQTDCADTNLSGKPTDSTRSILEQVDKDINVRSKTEPQTERSE